MCSMQPMSRRLLPSRCKIGTDQTGGNMYASRAMWIFLQSSCSPSFGADLIMAAMLQGEGDEVPEGVQPPVRDADNVMVCLKRALKIANSAQQQLAVVLKGDHTTPVMLFVEILNHYLFYFEQGNPSITTSVLQVMHLAA